MSRSLPTGINVSVLIGTLSRPPEVRPLPSGDDVLTLEVTVRAAGDPTDSVPVAWLGAPASAMAWQPGEELLVTGRTRRRFFRAGGVTQSRTEVVATAVVPTRRAASGRRALRAALEPLQLDASL